MKMIAVICLGMILNPLYLFAGETMNYNNDFSVSGATPVADHCTQNPSAMGCGGLSPDCSVYGSPGYCDPSCGHQNLKVCSSGDSNQSADLNAGKGLGPTKEPTGSSACESENTLASETCAGDSVVNIVTPSLTNFQAARANGDMKAACSAAQTISGAGFGMNTGFAVECERAATACVKECSKQAPAGFESSFKANLRECRGFSTRWQGALVQGLTQVQTFVQAGDCKKLAGGQCNGTDAFSNPTCIQQYCSVGNRLTTDPACNGLAQQCSNPSTARTNPACICVSNPTAPSCATGPGQFAGTGIDTKNLLNGLDNSGVVPPYAGNGPGGGKTGVEGQNGGGGGAGLGNGASGGGMGSGAGGAGDPNAGLNTNILGKPSNGGGYPFGGGAGGGGGYAFGANKGDGSGAKSLNLRDFLPGGKKDARQIASLTLAQQGISGAIGLTNFQKVTRKISEKRGTLVP